MNMPELPEVQTTVNGLAEHVIGLRIIDCWTDYNSPYFKGSDTIKDPKYFKFFQKNVIGKKIISVTRRAKNILINLDNDRTILVHMKMTGHLLYGRYESITRNKRRIWKPIEPESLKDPYNSHVHFMLTFDNKRNVALADVRKFAKVTLINSKNLEASPHLYDIGPEPLDRNFNLTKFNERLDLRPNSRIKQVLMDPKIVAGIGNIYADESLWRAGIHPLSQTKKVSSAKRAELFRAIRKTLSRGIDFGGDSTSDYRNVHGEKGRFHEQHYAYQKTGEKCAKRGCRGTIRRIMVGSRSAHYCDKHQKLTADQARRQI